VIRKAGCCANLKSTDFIMKHLAAYLLLQIGGNASPSAKDIKTVLESVGIEADESRLETLLSELKGKDISEVGWIGVYMMGIGLTVI
jgi:hypothetical protein